MTFFQIEHTENNSFERLQSLTTIIAIKCKEGLVMAGDSQGTANKYKKYSKKIFKINNTFAVGGAGDFSHIIELVSQLEKDFQSKQIDVETFLRDEISKTFAFMHKSKNKDHSSNSGYYLETHLPFCPEILITAKVLDEYYIYHGGFGEVGRYKVKTSDVFLMKIMKQLDLEVNLFI